MNRAISARWHAVKKYILFLFCIGKMPNFSARIYPLRNLGMAVLVGALLGPGLPSVAHAHPHVLVKVQTTLEMNAQGTLTWITHRWTFDEPYSVYATTGLDKNKDGKLDREELRDLAQVNVESLAEYGFFTRFKPHEGGNLDIKNPDKPNQSPIEFALWPDYTLEHDGKALTLTFTLVPKGPPPAVKSARLEIYDPSYFVAFAFDEQQPATLAGAPSPCKAEVHLPSSKALSKLTKLSEQMFDALARTSDQEADWASYIKVSCP